MRGSYGGEMGEICTLIGRLVVTMASPESASCAALKGLGIGLGLGLGGGLRFTPTLALNLSLTLSLSRTLPLTLKLRRSPFEELSSREGIRGTPGKG